MNIPKSTIVGTVLCFLLVSIVLFTAWPKSGGGQAAQALAPAKQSSSELRAHELEDTSLGPEDSPVSASPGTSGSRLAEEQSPLALELADPNSLRNLRGAVISGQMTRESNPTQYDEILRRIAKDSFRRSLESGTSSRAARFAGFISEDDMNRALEGLLDKRPDLHQELSQLVDRALGVSAYSEECALANWGDPINLEVWNPDFPHDSEQWKKEWPVTSFGLLRFSSSTRIGDRAFVTHFNSSQFPGLEAELQDLNLQKGLFWGQYKQDE